MYKHPSCFISVLKILQKTGVKKTSCIRLINLPSAFSGISSIDAEAEATCSVAFGVNLLSLYLGSSAARLVLGLSPWAFALES